jgi:very-short-patch-repair endonuclease
MARHGAAVLSHRAALHLWGLGDGLRRSTIEVTVAHATRPRSGRVDVHRTNHLPLAHLATRLGISVTSVERTLVDCAGLVSRGRLELAVENALRLRLATASDLDAVVEEMRGRRCRRVWVLRELLDARRAGGDGAAHGDLELATWRLIAASGLPMPRRQHVVNVDGVDWSVDFYWPRHRVGLETDGYESHQGLVAFRQDRRKLRALASAGCHVLPATWEDVTHRPEALVRDIERALRRAA